jgi:branched-chain amino acid transport system permease protein
MIQFLISGLVAGGLIAVSALALVLTYKTSKVFNFAQGGEAFLIAYIYYRLVEAGLTPPEAALVAGIGVSGIMGYLLWWLLFRHLTEARSSVRLTAMIGLEVALVALTLVIFGNHEVLNAVGIFRSTGSVIHVFGVGISANQLLTLGLAAFIAVGMTLFLHRTHAGVVLRGVVDSPDMSSGLGTNPNVVSALASVVATIMVGLTAIMLVPILGLDDGSFETFIAASFAAAIVARLSSFGAALAAGLGLGVLEAILTYALPTSSTFASGLPSSVPFLVIIAVVIFYALIGRAPTDGENQATPPIPVLEHPSAAASVAGRWDRYVGWSLLLATVVILPFLLSEIWLGAVAASICMGLIFLSWRVITAEAGIVSLAQAALAGLAACGAARLALSAHMPVAIAILLGALAAAAIGALLGVIVLPLGSLYAALATFAFGLFADNMLFKTSFLNPLNSGIALGRPEIGPLKTDGTTSFYVLAIVVFALVATALAFWRRSTTGMVFAAVRSSPQRAATLGINVKRVRVVAFIVGSFIAGLGGALLASFQYSAQPLSFGTMMGLVWFAIIMLNGVYSIGGAVAAGMGALLLPQLLSTYVSPTWSNYLPIGFGIGAVVIAKDPAGAAGHFRHLSRKAAQWLERMWKRGESIPVGIGSNDMDAASEAVPVASQIGSAAAGEQGP